MNDPVTEFLSLVLDHIQNLEKQAVIFRNMGTTAKKYAENSAMRDAGLHVFFDAGFFDDQARRHEGEAARLKLELQRLSRQAGAASD